MRLSYERAQHPYYERQGKVKALETIKFSILTHRGCYGECNFCAIAVHEGRTVQWRSEESILGRGARDHQVSRFQGLSSWTWAARRPTCTASNAARSSTSGACPDKRCLYPAVCPSMKADHRQQMELLARIRRIEGVKKVFVASGIRYDLLLSDRNMASNILRKWSSITSPAR